MARPPLRRWARRRQGREEREQRVVDASAAPYLASSPQTPPSSTRPRRGQLELLELLLERLLLLELLELLLAERLERLVLLFFLVVFKQQLLVVVAAAGGSAAAGDPTEALEGLGRSVVHIDPARIEMEDEETGQIILLFLILLAYLW